LYCNKNFKEFVIFIVLLSILSSYCSSAVYDITNYRKNREAEIYLLSLHPHFCPAIASSTIDLLAAPPNKSLFLLVWAELVMEKRHFHPHSSNLVVNGGQ